MPVYNGERFLREALDSIVGQTFGDFVLVVSDNASTDATPEIVAEYAARDERVVLLRSEENHGAAWNFNHVVEQCRTPFFKWAAADDVLAPTCVERCLLALREAPPSVVLCYPQTRWIDAEGKLGRITVDPLTTSADAPAHRRLARVVANAVYGNVAYAVMRVDALRRTRLHGNYPSADMVLLAELALVGAFLEVPEPLFYRRDHEQASRRSNPSPEELSLWYDPNSRAVRHEFTRLFFEHLAGIRSARLRPAERMLAYVTFLTLWSRRRAQIRTRTRGVVERLRPRPLAA